MILPTIYTIGHASRSLSGLTDLLQTASISELVDVRSSPVSRRHPYLVKNALARSLPENGILYAHEPALGGRCKPLPDSPNGAWQSPSLRAFADHLASASFGRTLEHLEARARRHPVCLMCTERNWRRCHRRLIGDALLIRNWRVLHLGMDDKPRCHELTPFAVVGERDHTLTYPPLQMGCR